MRFITIPNSDNLPTMINPSNIESIEPDINGKLIITFISGCNITTTLPREILVDILRISDKEESKPQVVNTDQFAG